MKKSLSILVFLILSVSLFACGGGKEKCETCVDGDGDSVCDVCGAEVQATVEEVSLIENGEAKFQIVIASDTPLKARNFVNAKLAGALRNKHDINVKVVIESGENDTPTDTEVLIGDVKSRGEKYQYDKYSLGEKGYVLKITDGKVIINGGGEDGLLAGLEKFANEILGISDDYIDNVTLSSTDTGAFPQSDYRVKSISLNGEDMRGYTIAADLDNQYHKEAAEAMNSLFYTYAGYYMKVVDVADASERSIVFKKIDKTYGENSFKIYPSEKSLVIECAFDNELLSAVSLYFNERIMGGAVNVNFTGTYKKDVSFVTYEQFGAVGDGKTDDFEAIYKTHEFANVSGQKVLGSPGATYYIFNSLFAKSDTASVSRNSAQIQTNVDWQGANFIIDDRWLSARSGETYNNMCGGYIFIISPNTEHKIQKIEDRETLDRITAEGVNRDTERINIELDGWDGELFIVVYNKNHKVFRRYPYDVYTGGDMRDIIVLDKDGYVSDETPITFDYTNIDYIEVYRLDKSTAITVENGNFTTRVCQYNTVIEDPETKKLTTNGASGITRGIKVSRSYSTIRNIKHYVTDEKLLSDQVDENGKVIYCAPVYNGFYSASNATDMLFEGCILSGRRCYKRPQGGTAGTYDISVNTANNVYFKDCHQHNFWVTVDPDTYEMLPATKDTPGAISSMTPYTVNGTSLQMHWGISASNYSKNFYFVDSTLSRYDAHCGVYNGGIINTTVNYVEIIGNGTFIMDRMTYYSSGSNAVIPTRADYGWTWEGEILLTDVKAYVYTDRPDRPVRLLYHGYENWYFGYTCHFPSISVDNLDFYDIKTGEPLPAGYRIELTNSVEQYTKMHLKESHENPIYSVEDKDGDGYIDEPFIDRDLDGKIDPPFDYDGNGDPYNTAYPIEEIKAVLGDDVKRGYIETESTANFNITVPPQYIKIVGNDGIDGSGGYVYYVTDTSGMGISDGGYYADETYGGFYGGTRFIWGEGENDYIIGTDTQGRTDVRTFVFE